MRTSPGSPRARRRVAAEQASTADETPGGAALSSPGKSPASAVPPGRPAKPETRAAVVRAMELQEKANEAHAEARALLVRDLREEHLLTSQVHANGAADDPYTESLRRLSTPPATEVFQRMRCNLFNRQAEPKGPIAVFDEGAVKVLAFVHILMGIRARTATQDLPSRKNLASQERLIEQLLAARPTARHAVQLKAMLSDVRMFHHLQRLRAPGDRTGTCPAMSGLITDLVTWFHLCHELATYLAKDFYDFAGEFVTALSTPRCLVCGEEHRFRNWRAVYARDQHRRLTPARRTLLLPEVFWESALRDAPIPSAEHYGALQEGILRLMEATHPGLVGLALPSKAAHEEAEGQPY